MCRVGGTDFGIIPKTYVVLDIPCLWNAQLYFIRTRCNAMHCRLLMWYIVFFWCDILFSFISDPGTKWCALQCTGGCWCDLMFSFISDPGTKYSTSSASYCEHCTKIFSNDGTLHWYCIFSMIEQTKSLTVFQADKTVWALERWYWYSYLCNCKDPLPPDSKCEDKDFTQFLLVLVRIYFWRVPSTTKK